MISSVSASDSPGAQVSKASAGLLLLCVRLDVAALWFPQENRRVSLNLLDQRFAPLAQSAPLLADSIRYSHSTAQAKPTKR